MTTALVYDWLVEPAGGEKALEAIYELYPSPIYTLVHNQKTFKPTFLTKGIHTSFIQKMPFGSSCYRYYLPFFPLAIEQFDIRDYRVVISLSHAVAKGVLTHPDQLHLCYCFTPMRYAWDLMHCYLERVGIWQKGFARFALHYLRNWDIASLNRVDHFVAISHYIARRIRKFYGREPSVIYPPVDVERFCIQDKKEEYFITVSRLVPYKRVDLIVKAFSYLPQHKLLVIGSGPEMKKIKQLATKNVEILGYQPDEIMRSYVAKAKGFIFAAEEDFGICVLEAQAAGVPIIAFGKGATLETVIENQTGVFFEKQQVASLLDAIACFEKKEFDPNKIYQHAQKFSRKRFHTEFRALVDKKIEENMKAIILAGGSGTRLWPYSRREMPKQFLHFGEKRSLLQKTIERFIPIIDPKDILIVTSQDYFHLVKTQAMEISLRLENQILIEPEQKNTAPAIALAICYLTSFLKISPQECVLICSSDHLIAPQEVFIHALVEAEKIAQKARNVIFGIRPNKPETGYGYIKLGVQEQENVYHVDSFVEKPDFSLAQKYLLSGQYLWNSGVFLFQIKTFIKELQQYCPEIGKGIPEDFKEFVTRFSELPNLSIDYALMEKSTNTKVMRLDLNWSDVGSWDSVYDLLEKDQHNNAKMGNVLDIDTKNCLIMGNKRLISTIGLEDLIVVETADALFIGKRRESQRVKALVEELQKKEAKESYLHPTSHRPWGHFTVLEEAERYKLKRIVVEPKQRLSLQMHYHRSEHWVVVKGTAKVTIDQQETILSENESIFVPKRAIHRLENPGKVLLELIEVQVGEYVGEDDIVRLEDVYQRT